MLVKNTRRAGEGSDIDINYYIKSLCGYSPRKVREPRSLASFSRGSNTAPRCLIKYRRGVFLQITYAETR